MFFNAMLQSRCITARGATASLAANDCLDVTVVRGLAGVVDELSDLSGDGLHRVQGPGLVPQQ